VKLKPAADNLLEADRHRCQSGADAGPDTRSTARPPVVGTAQRLGIFGRLLDGRLRLRPLRPAAPRVAAWARAVAARSELVRRW